ncbi:energy transducer TonB [Helicobacter brantae]|uniref:TonB C-terminal domain-containing protein n=1 Tax=Helicobacter brantae TaxID=375927 RepID=A0A3D8J0N4_9HELI|nr:energy transducer TonB [Helicobacter brantae]RDU71099.1 hypothetical protein CQA58_03015 [Helicobacter brantae]
MKTLLLAHTKSSAFLLTLLVCLCVFCVAKRFYQETHHFAKRGNAPINLKVLSLSQVAQKPSPSPSRIKKQKPSSKTQQKAQNTQKQVKESKREQGKISQAEPMQNSIQERVEQKEIEQKGASQTQEESEQGEVSQEIELIASMQGRHFELYEKVYGAILKNVFYPKKARYRKITGVVVVEFVLERDGGISQERVVQSSGYALLDESAIKTLNQTQFPTSPKRYRFRVPLRYG